MKRTFNLVHLGRNEIPQGYIMGHGVENKRNEYLLLVWSTSLQIYMFLNFKSNLSSKVSKRPGKPPSTLGNFIYLSENRCVFFIHELAGKAI